MAQTGNQRRLDPTPILDVIGPRFGNKLGGFEGSMKIVDGKISDVDNKLEKIFLQVMPSVSAPSITKDVVVHSMFSKCVARIIFSEDFRRCFFPQIVKKRDEIKIACRELLKHSLDSSCFGCIERFNENHLTDLGIVSDFLEKNSFAQDVVYIFYALDVRYVPQAIYMYQLDDNMGVSVKCRATGGHNGWFKGAKIFSQLMQERNMDKSVIKLSRQ